MSLVAQVLFSLCVWGGGGARRGSVKQREGQAGES